MRHHDEFALMGFLRVFLALCVIQDHTDRLFPSWFSLNAREAVQAFYVISGFYVAMILNLKYVGPGQTGTFYINRILRLWPPYLVVALLTGILMFRTGQLSAMIEQIRTFPVAAQLLIAFSNIFIVGQDALWFLRFDPGSISFAPFDTGRATNGYQYALIVVMFTVSIEFLFYAVAQYIVRNLRNVLWLAAIGLAYHAVLRSLGESHLAYTYHLFLSAIWFFAIGILAFHIYLRHRNALTHRPVPMLLLTMVVVILINLIGKKIYFPEARIAYVSLQLGCILPVLHALSQRARIDRTVGELSYGMYLVHLPIANAYQYFLGDIRSAPVALLSILAAALLYMAVERPIDRLRQQLAQRKIVATPMRQASTVVPSVAQVAD
jgi:peptidoglycan/LPS O-acetylase OafA/YrhL